MYIVSKLTYIVKRIPLLACGNMLITMLEEARENAPTSRDMGALVSGAIRQTIWVGYRAR